MRAILLSLVAAAQLVAAQTPAPTSDVAASALDSGLARARAEGLFPTGGAVVILRDGEPAGTASLPGPGRESRAVPAGSVVKPFVAAAALESGLIEAEGLLACPDRFDAGGASIGNHREGERSPLSISDAIARSCNTAFAAIGARAGAGEVIASGLRRFGFGAPTGWSGREDPGVVPATRSVEGAMLAAIGQGPLTVTPLQVARAYDRLASAPGLEAVRDGMRRTVTDGTAASAFAGWPHDRIPIAGKTGSAEVGDATPYAWFAGYATAGDARYVVVVVIERGREGALSAAPIARDIFARLLEAGRDPPVPLPHPVALLLAVPLAAGLARGPAGPLAGFAAGVAAGWLGGGSAPANAIAFSVAGWLAWRVPAPPPVAAAIAAAAGTIALPHPGHPAWWIAARAAIAGAIAFVVVVAGTRARSHAVAD